MPCQGSWFILRMYRPRAEVVQASWRCQPSEGRLKRAETMAGLSGAPRRRLSKPMSLDR
jgi:hypothetical protein